MKARYRLEHDLHDTVFDFSESQFSSHELIKQVAQRLRDHQGITTLTIEKAELDESAADALCQAVVQHESLKSLSLLDVTLCSYVAAGSEDYFPKDLDNAVEHLCVMLRESKLTNIELTELEFSDRTQRTYEHFDMVDPSAMRDLLTNEKQPFYIKKIVNSLHHNPHLLRLCFSTKDINVFHFVRDIESDIKKRHAAEEVNAVFQGTHAAVEAYLMPEIMKAFAMGFLFGRKTRKTKY